VSAPAKRAVLLPSGETVPALGLGTWNIGDDQSRRAQEIAALREGIELGMTLIDTAEMYGDGRAEELIRKAIEGRRDDVFLVSKAYPYNAGRDSLPKACERSLRRLGTDRIDLYLLHWRGGIALAETVAAFEALRKAGEVRHWGVSNFDVADMEELVAAGGEACATNQVLYNFARRGPEYDLLPWMERRRMPVMAYSPVAQGNLPNSGVLASIARKRSISVAQVALAWLLRRPDAIVIPKAAKVEHVRDNHNALAVALTGSELAEIDQAYPGPERKVPLDML
jgi:diketogulonate reductase-like aldo/keto reductase